MPGIFVRTQPTSAQFFTNTIDSTNCPICFVFTGAILSYPPYAGCSICPIVPSFNVRWPTNKWFRPTLAYSRPTLAYSRPTLPISGQRWPIFG